MYADKEERLAVMSIGFLLENKNDAIVWRGPKKNGSFSLTNLDLLFHVNSNDQAIFRRCCMG